jgi:cysteine sulfinate desulfinase/cysteine desulfurase-like protein
MGIAPELAMAAVRFSPGRMTTREEIDVLVERLAHVFARAE